MVVIIRTYHLTHPKSSCLTDTSSINGSFFHSKVLKYQKVGPIFWPVQILVSPSSNPILPWWTFSFWWLRALSECQLHNPPVVVVDIDIPHEDELFTLLKEPSKYSLDNHPLITPVHGLNPHLFNGSSFCGGDKQPYSWQWKKKTSPNFGLLHPL